MLGHVVLLFAGFAFERTATLGAKPSETAAALVTGPMARTFAGGYVECLGFIVLLFAGMLPPGCFAVRARRRPCGRPPLHR